MSNLIDLLRKKHCRVVYDVEYNESWSDEELLLHIIELSLLYQISLPPTQDVDITGRPHNKYSEDEKHEPSSFENIPPTKLLFKHCTICDSFNIL